MCHGDPHRVSLLVSRLPPGQKRSGIGSYKLSRNTLTFLTREGEPLIVIESLINLSAPKARVVKEG